MGVPPTARDLKLEFTKKDGEAVVLDIMAKDGDDIEELATYINGQTDLFKASVDQEGKMQILLLNRILKATSISPVVWQPNFTSMVAQV